MRPCRDCGKTIDRADPTAEVCWACKLDRIRAYSRRYYRKSHVVQRRKPCDAILCNNTTLARRKWCNTCAAAFFGVSYMRSRKARDLVKAA